MNDFLMNSLFKNSWSIYRERFWTMVAIMLLSIILTFIVLGVGFALFAEEIMQYMKFNYYMAPDASLLRIIIPVIVILYLVDLLINGSLFALVSHNQDIGPKKSFSIGIKKILHFLLIDILRIIAILGIPVILFTGLNLLQVQYGLVVILTIITLIFPGIMFMTWFSLAPCALFKNNLWGFKALGKSKSLVSRNFRSVFWRLFIITATISLINLTAVSMIEGPSAFVVNVLTMPFLIAFLYSMYKSLNTGGEDIQRSADNTVFESQETHHL